MGGAVFSCGTTSASGSSTFTPHWKNKHVIKRAETVLNWDTPFLIGNYGSVTPLHLSAKGFKYHFGHTVPGLSGIFGPTGHRLGDFLRVDLLVPVSTT